MEIHTDRHSFEFEAVAYVGTRDEFNGCVGLVADGKGDSRLVHPGFVGSRNEFALRTCIKSGKGKTDRCRREYPDSHLWFLIHICRLVLEGV